MKKTYNSFTIYKLNILNSCILFIIIITLGENMRELNKDFIEDLIQGSLSKLLKIVQSDDTLCLEIRNNYINIYYRGGSILKIDANKTIFFDSNYIIKNNLLWLPFDPNTLKTLDDYIDYIPLFKREMDLWFYQNPKLEREYQQVILRENNLSNITNDTDYYITDLEYADSKNKSRFDMIGIKWLSTSSSRKNNKAQNLALIEVKYSDNNITGASGIVKHFADMEKFINNNRLESLMIEAQTQFNQKVQLGLIKNINKTIEVDNKSKPEYILVFVNHKPASSVLLRELNLARNNYYNLFDMMDVKIASSSIMGYGLYANQMINIDEFIKLNKD